MSYLSVEEMEIQLKNRDKMRELLESKDDQSLYLIYNLTAEIYYKRSNKNIDISQEIGRQIDEMNQEQMKYFIHECFHPDTIANLNLEIGKYFSSLTKKYLPTIDDY